MSANIGEGKYVISVDNSGALNQLGQFEQKAKSTGQGVKDSFLLGASGALNLAGGLKGLYNEFDQLEKVQTRIKKTNLEVSRAQEELNKLTAEGKAGTLDYEQALQRLEIAKDKNKQANDDLFKGNLEVAFSVAQIAVGVPAAIKALEGLSAVKKILTAVTWAETFAFLANPLFAIPTAAAIATAVGLVATNTWGLRDALFGTTEAVDANTDAMRAYKGELSDYGNTASSASSATRDLNNEMDRTINNLKKNEISGELEKLKAEMSEGIFIMGSLEQVYNSFKSAGVGGFVREIAKDTRTLDNVNKVKSAVISLYSIISGRALPSDALGPNIHGELSYYQIGTIRRKDWNPIASSVYQFGRAISYSRASGGGISYLGGQANTVKGTFASLGGVNMTGTASQKLMSGLRTIKNKPRRGSMVEKRNQFDTMATSFFGGSMSLDAANTQAQRTIDLLTAEGVDIPNYLDFGMSNGARGGRVSFNQAGFNTALDTAISEAKRRRQAREDAILGLANRSGLTRSEVMALQTTQQGTDDLYGIIDYRERLARASTGTG